MFTPTYHKRNLENINKLAPKTKELALKWYNYCISKNVDVLIYETLRTEEKQREYVEKGASKTMKSYHLVGQALDFVPIVNNKADWSAYSRKEVQDVIAYAKKLGFTWGGDWTTFKDMPHLQYDKIPYGEDKELPKAPTVSKKENQAAKTQTPKARVGVVLGDVWVRTSPTIIETNKLKVLKKGQKVNVYGEKGSFYKIGENMYSSKKYIKLI